MTTEAGATPLSAHDDESRRLLPPVALPILWVAVLYLTMSGRWGSYLGIPGLPFYIGDIALVAAAVQVALHVRRAELSLRDIGGLLARADLALLLALTLMAWAGVRGVTGLGSLAEGPLLYLRDLAPFAYILTALLAFVLPADGGRRQGRLIYVALTLHVSWILLAGQLPGWPWDGPLLGGTPIFTARPDFDSAVAGAAVALAVHDVLLGSRRRDVRTLVATAAFVLANGAAVLSLQTRAGLLSGVVMVGAVLLVWVTRSRITRAGRAGRVQRSAVLVAALAVLSGVVALSPPGERLVQAVTGQESQALGTVQVREFAWTGVASYVVADAARTAVGVGFGPDFIQDSGTAYSLEGTEYADVRSPHNYLIGSLARLGVAGALLSLLTMGAAAVLGVRRLAGGTPDAPTVLAALLVLGLPVTALLGVVLESPFGAIPYFWAIGQLAACSRYQP